MIIEAENDLVDIYNYISIHDSSFKAEKIIKRIEDECLKLEILPERGRIVPELKKIEIVTYLELIFKPFRIIYQTINNAVYIHAILDSRRDLEELLYNRLIQK